MTRTRAAALVLLVVTGLAGCSGSSSGAAATPSASPAASPSAAASKTIWLCRPGMTPNPCESGVLDATALTPGGGRSTERFTPAADPAVDCFYVYPTVSSAPGTNAPLASSPTIVSAARAQASRFSSVCRLFVPVYRQVTVGALLSGRFFDTAAQATAYGDVVRAWHDYLARDNGGRGVVLIGHSQGAMALAKLVAKEMDPDPAARKRLVSALLLGGQVTTAAGKDVGGTFTSVPACRKPAQTGCVVGYSTFSSPPPANSYFGRAPAGKQALCTDPSVLGGTPGSLHPYLPAERVPSAPRLDGFVAYPGSLRATCRTAAGATWLQVSRVAGSPIPEQPQDLGPQWGLHVGDVNLALGDLVETVRRQVAAYRP
jgi:hypothetical protein